MRFRCARDVLNFVLAHLLRWSDDAGVGSPWVGCSAKVERGIEGREGREDGKEVEKKETFMKKMSSSSSRVLPQMAEARSFVQPFRWSQFSSNVLIIIPGEAEFYIMGSWCMSSCTASPSVNAVGLARPAGGSLVSVRVKETSTVFVMSASVKSFQSKTSNTLPALISRRSMPSSCSSAWVASENPPERNSKQLMSVGGWVACGHGAAGCGCMTQLLWTSSGELTFPFLDGLLVIEDWPVCPPLSFYGSEMKKKEGILFAWRVIALAHAIGLVGGGSGDGRGHVQAPEGSSLGVAWRRTRIRGPEGICGGSAREEAALALGYVLRVRGGVDARGESDVVSEQEAQAASVNNAAAMQRDAADQLHQWNLERAEILRELKARPIEVPEQFCAPWQSSVAWNPVKDEMTFKERLEAAVAEADGARSPRMLSFPHNPPPSPSHTSSRNPEDSRH